MNARLFAAPAVVGQLLEVGVAVADLEAATSRLVDLFGAPASAVIASPDFHMRFQMCRTGSADFELMQGEPGTLIDRFVQRRGEGLHHIAFAVDDARAALAACRGRGLPVLQREPVRMDNLEAFFLHPSCLAGVLVEFIENRHPWIDGVPLPTPEEAAGAVDVCGFGIQVAALEQAAGAFEAILGAVTSSVHEDPAGRFRACRSRVANMQLRLVQRRDLGADAPGHGGALRHVILRARDLDATARVLERAGVRLTEPPPEWRAPEDCVFTAPESFHGVALQIVRPT